MLESGGFLLLVFCFDADEPVFDIYGFLFNFLFLLLPLFEDADLFLVESAYVCNLHSCSDKRYKNCEQEA